MIDGITGIATLVEPRATAAATTGFAFLGAAALGTYRTGCGFDDGLGRGRSWSGLRLACLWAYIHTYIHTYIVNAMT